MEYLQLIEILIPVVREVDKINSGMSMSRTCDARACATCKKNDNDFIILR